MMIKINEVLWFQEGPGVRNTQYTDSGVKLLNVANLVNGNVDLTTSSRYISNEEAYGKYKHFLVDEGDFIIASSGIKVEYFDKKMGFVNKEQLPLCMNTSTIRFKVLDPNKLNIKYFMYYLKSNSFKQQLARQITGSAQLNFGPSHLNKMYMPMCSLSEQNSIVSKLDKIFEIIKIKELELNRLDELVKSRFVEMFGDPIINSNMISMTECCKIIDGDRGINYPKADEFYDTEYCLFLNAKNVTKNGFDFSNCSFITKEKDNALRNGKLSIGDIVLTTRGTIGNLAYFDKNIPFDNVRINSGMVIIRVDRNLVNETYFIEQLRFKIDYIIKKISSGSAQPQLPINVMNKIKIYLPPIELQNQFAEFVEKVDKSKFDIEQSIEKLETLKKSLMQEYFG